MQPMIEPPVRQLKLHVFMIVSATDLVLYYA